MHASSGVITKIVVGKEAIFVELVSVEQLRFAISIVRNIAQKAGLRESIGSAGVNGVWTGQQNPLGTKQIPPVDIMPVLKDIDWFGLNTHPYYISQDPLVADARDNQVQAAQALVAQLQGMNISKPVIITETGYPDTGKTLVGGGRTAPRPLPNPARARRKG
jgi:exo-beta-1,3-glucanase (GH17 family)